jgi:hypothetical protein
MGMAWAPGAARVRAASSRLRPRSTVRLCGLYTAGMTEDIRPGEETAEREEPPALPRHLSALIGALRGPADLGRNHDKYLSYADREEAGGAASA